MGILKNPIKNFLLLLNLITVLSVIQGLESNKNEFECDDDPETSADQILCLPKNYQVFQAPLRFGSTKVEVTIAMDEIVDIKDNVVTFSCYLNSKWKDSRIVRRVGYGRSQAGPGVDYRNNPNIWVPNDMKLFDHIWKPDLFIYNLKDIKRNVINQKMEGLWISTDGEVMHSFAPLISVYCPMDYTRFPLDVQSCKVRVGSYSKNDKMMHFTSDNDGVWRKNDNYFSNMPQDYNIRLKDLGPEDSVFIAGALGNFSLAGLEIQLERKLASYITTYYIPSGLLVIISWVSFLIPIHRMDARVSLLSIAFLVLTALSVNVMNTNPKQSQLNALEVWMLVCICFVFATFLEYAIILLKRHQKFAKTLTVESVKYEATSNGLTSSESDIDDEFWRYDKSYLALFSVLFIIFNVAYWLAYLI